MPITVTNTFVPATVILSAEVNQNFSDITTQAVAKSGDTLTGLLTGTAFTASGALTGASAVITGTGAGALDVGGGINAGTGNVGIVDATGKIPALTSTYFASLDGSALTGLAAGESDQTVLAVQIFS